MSIDDCKLIELPKITDPRGNLTFIENGRHIPFDIKRTYYIYNIPEKADRGAHGHKKLRQVVISLYGSFKIFLDDGVSKQEYFLSKPNEGLYIAPMVWGELNDFTQGVVCLVLASDFYKEEDYYRNYKDFLIAVARSKKW